MLHTSCREIGVLHYDARPYVTFSQRDLKRKTQVTFGMYIGRFYAKKKHQHPNDIILNEHDVMIKDKKEITNDYFVNSLRSKRFQSSYCAKVRARAKKGGRGKGRGGEETLACKPYDSGKRPLIFHGSVHL